MKQKHILVLIMGVAILALCAGCAGNGSGGTPTPTITTAPPTTAVTPPPLTYSLTPSPTQTLPAGTELSFEVKAGPSLIKPTVVVVFRGGSGQSQIQSMGITFIRPSGQFETRPLEARVGSEQEFSVTRNEVDRVVITVTLYSGQQFRVWDQVFEYYSHT